MQPEGADMIAATARSAESFELDVESHNALDVFHHPFAYAVQRGSGSLEPVLGASLS
jgi:hypothetical protein